ncbi:MAG: hypothetical protein JW829_14930, partial [Pirellulales bacterium]|nr:hypothetical protein [Pirellulales bacterium]
MKMTSTICLTLTFLLGISISSLASITGAGDFEHNSEFLFGWSGGSSYPQENELDLVFQSGGTATLDTNTNNFTVGVRNQGWWNREGNFANAQDTNDNYFVGDLSNDGTQLLNNFFTFDISNLSGTVVGATLQLVRWHGGSDSG